MRLPVKPVRLRATSCSRQEGEPRRRALSSPASGRCVRAVTFGGAEDDEARGIAVAADGDWIVAGSFRATVDFDPGTGTTSVTSAGEEDLFVARLSAADGRK